jgi:hypothetical protein
VPGEMTVIGEPEGKCNFRYGLIGLFQHLLGTLYAAPEYIAVWRLAE